MGLSIDGPTGFTSKAGSAGAQFPGEQGMRPQIYFDRSMR
jgi:hypothetical protein